MKPVRLIVEGFTSFRTKQELSFETLELFAISGPTGSGKSSILDAMMYALFGEIPRLGGQGYQEIISHGSPRLAVTFDFKLRARTYRAVRTLRKKGQTSAQLVEIDPATGEEMTPLAGSVREVDARVEELLGLTFAAFAQAVVLPQGEFQRFLKARPADRRELLSRLLRLGRYELVRKTASKRRDEADARAAAMERQLFEDYAGIDGDTIAAMIAELEGCDGTVESLRLASEDAARAFEETRDIARSTEALVKKTDERNRLSSRHEAVERDRARLASARRAAGLRDLVDGVARTRQAASDCSKRLADALSALGANGAKLKTATDDLKTARASADELPSLRARIGQLDQAIGLQSATDASAEQLASAKTDTATAQTALDALRRKLPIADKAASTAVKHLDDAQRAADAIGYSSERAAWLRELAPAARSLVDLQHRLDDQRLEVEAATMEHEKAAKARDKARDVATRAQEKLTEATARVKEAEDALRREERGNHAALLRKGLREGDECPVCDQPVKARVSVPRGAERALQAALDALERAREIEDGARKANEHARTALARTEADADTATKRLAKAEKQIVAEREKYAKEDTKLRKELSAATLEPALPTDPTALLQEEEELARRHTRWEKANKKLTDANGASVAAAAELSRLTIAEENATTALRGATERMEKAREAHDALRAKVRSAAGGDEDPRATKERLEHQARALDRQLEKARSAHAAAETELRVAETHRDEATQRVSSAAADLDERERSLGTRATEAGFASAEAAGAALLEEPAMSQLDREISDYDASIEVLTRELAELRETLGERRATREDVTAREHAKKGAEKAHDDAGAHRVELATRLEIAREKLGKAVRLRRQVVEIRSDEAVHACLAKELQTDGFLEYLLMETQRELVAGASIRLRELSDRYTLEIRDGDFYVVDHDNAGEQRRVDTLSGGETFLTSLALALELSAQIQATAGAAQLDSIFIDEGFGTLDPETLETVASAIESLPSSGRMVGIVTHVADLTERMPTRIVVKKGTAGSTVIVG